MAAKKKHTRRARAPQKPKPAQTPTRAGKQLEAAPALPVDGARVDSRLERATSPLIRRPAAIVESSADAIFSKDLDGTIQSWNRGAERLYGYTREEAVGQSIKLIFPKDRAEECATIMTQLRRGETVERLETERIRKDGQRIPVDVTASPVRDSSGRVVGASVIARDISGSKRTEAVLRESENRFRLMADAAPVMIWMSGIDKLCTWFNKPWLDFVGRPMEQELGNGWAENIHADDYEGCLKRYTKAFDARQPFSMEYRLKRHDGEYRWLLDNGVPLYGADGDFSGYIGSCIDITERRKAEESVAATNRHLKLAMSAGRMAAWTWDPHKDLVSTSENLRELCGVSSIENREHGEALLHPEDRGRHSKIVDYALEHGTPYQSVFRMVRRDNGQVIWLDLRAVPVTDSEGHFTTLSGVAIDITDRKQAEQNLLASEERLRAILDTAMDAIITIDEQGIIQSVNAATERMFGYAASEMIGQNVKMLMPSPYRESHDNLIAKFLQTREKHVLGINREVEARRKDGSIFPTELVVSEIKHLKLFTGIHRDLTERRQLERDVVETASLEQRRIGQDLHDSVAQELTALNLLAKDLTETLATDPAKALELTRQIRSGLQRSQEELRAVMRGLLPVAVDSGGLMAALADLADRIQQEGKVSCTFECPEPVSVADNLTATHVFLIAQEAVHNAVRHAQTKKVRISLTSNERLVLSVQDDGIGMADRPGENQGLGLRIMRNRAAIIGATLTIEPAEPTGTVVTCTLARKHNAPRQEKETQPGPHRR